MAEGRHENFQRSLEIKQDDKFFSRIMSKDTSMANSSSRVYYGGASGAIPFVWESRPGTPKHPFADSSIPPLTPPPSYYSTSKAKSMHKNMKPNFLGTIFPRLTPKKSHVSPSFSMSSKASSSSSSSSSASSSSSWLSSSLLPGNSKLEKRSSCLFSRSPVHYTVYEDDSDDERGTKLPTSTLCFSNKKKSLNGFGNMKNAFLSVVGHGSG